MKEFVRQQHAAGEPKAKSQRELTDRQLGTLKLLAEGIIQQRDCCATGLKK